MQNTPHTQTKPQRAGRGWRTSWLDSVMVPEGIEQSRMLEMLAEAGIARTSIYRLAENLSIIQVRKVPGGPIYWMRASDAGLPHEAMPGLKPQPENIAPEGGASREVARVNPATPQSTAPNSAAMGIAPAAGLPPMFEGKPVRVEIGANGEPVFVACDVVEAVGAHWSARAIEHIPAQWKGMYPIHTPGGHQDMTVLTEQGVYFYLNRSDKPKALPIQMWIASEVLPSIRRTGGYGVAPQTDILDAIIADPTRAAQALLSQASVIAAKTAELEQTKYVAITYQRERDAAQEESVKYKTETEKLNARLVVYHAYMKGKDAITMTDAARLLGVKRDWLIAFLQVPSDINNNQGVGWAFRSESGFKPYATARDRGYLTYSRDVLSDRVRSDGSPVVRDATRVTNPGLDKLERILTTLNVPRERQFQPSLFN